MPAPRTGVSPTPGGLRSRPVAPTEKRWDQNDSSVVAGALDLGFGVGLPGLSGSSQSAIESCGLVPPLRFDRVGAPSGRAVALGAAAGACAAAGVGTAACGGALSAGAGGGGGGVEGVDGTSAVDRTGVATLADGAIAAACEGAELACSRTTSPTSKSALDAATATPTAVRAPRRRLGGSFSSST
jgi:hypothetical protein